MWQILLYARLGEVEKKELDGSSTMIRELGEKEEAKELHDEDLRFELQCSEKRAELEVLEKQCRARRMELRELEDGTWEWDAGGGERLSELPDGPCRCSPIGSVRGIADGDPG